tara:strand:+ start:69 stop:314 length:246 start_codon:yes stop_codon:yes gene_type:complete
MKDIGEKFLQSLGIICREFREELDKADQSVEARKKALIAMTEEQELDLGYYFDENGSRLSYCCGTMLDPDSDLCPTCLEHC